MTSPPTEYNTAFVKQPFAARQPIFPTNRYQRGLPKNTNDRRFIGQPTEYSKSFVEQSYSAREAIIPKSEIPSNSGIFSDHTTNKDDFLPHSIEIPVRYRPPRCTQLGGDMSFSTSYNEDFTPKRLDNVLPAIPRSILKQSNVKFTSEPRYREDFPEWKILSEPPRRFKNSSYCPPSTVFEGRATYTDDFICHPAKKQRSFKPIDNVGNNDNAPFIDSTHYKETFVGYKIAPREIKQHDENTSLPKVPLDGKTTHMLDFQPCQPVHVEPIKPKVSLTSSVEKMASSTTNKDDFVEWSIDKNGPKYLRKKWRRPSGKIDFNTTMQSHFKPHKVEPIKIIRRPGKRDLINAKFSAVTQYQDDFVNKELPEKSKTVVRDSELIINEPFVGQSTYDSEFVKHPWEQPQRIKNDNRSTVFPLVPHGNNNSDNQSN